MADTRLVKIFGNKAHTQDQLIRMDIAQEKYNLPLKFFGGLVRPIGLEFEMEGAYKYLLAYNKAHPFAFWQLEQDGSLKDDGIEMVSVPLAGYNIDYALAELENSIYNLNVKSSVRTSIHVHVDVSDFTVEELFTLTSLYALFEKPFFSLQSANRQSNSYCYEVTDLLPADIAITESMKYCAFNLAPAENQLTVEFRHADFSKDMRTNRRWIQIVCKFMNYAGRNRERIQEIVNNTILTDDYLKLFHTIMGKSTKLFDLEKVPEMMKSNALWSAVLLEIL